MRTDKHMSMTPALLSESAVTYIVNAFNCPDVPREALVDVEEYLAHLFWAERSAAYEHAASVAESGGKRLLDRHACNQVAIAIRALRERAP